MLLLEEVLALWRANPDGETTIALCALLGSSGREMLVREVASRAERDHGGDARVLLAVGRMCLEAELLSEAQSALVLAGKSAPRDPQPFRALGEVLLRRGDAERSRRLFQKAIELGGEDPETRLWLDRTVAFAAVQKRVGVDGVAAEVARGIGAASDPGAPSWTDEPETLVRSPAPQGPAVPDSPSGKRPPPRPVRPPPPPSKTAAGATAGASLQAKAVSSGALPGVDSKGTGPGLALGPKAPVPEAPLPEAPGVPAVAVAATGLVTSSLPSSPANFWNYGATAPTISERLASDAPVQGERLPPVNLGNGEIDPSTIVTPVLQRTVDPRMYASAPSAVGGAVGSPPEPRLVLRHLAKVGLYEPDQGATLDWEPSARHRTRGSWVLLGATLIIFATGLGAYVFASRVKAERVAIARRDTEEISVLLSSGGLVELQATDAKLSRIFDLDSRSTRGAKLWLQNRVLRSFWLREESRGINSAEQRARSVGVPPAEVVYGRIASFLVEGDVAGAAGVIKEWEAPAARDPWFQLAAGVALEVAGEPRAAERYRIARQLDPALFPADLLLARLVLIEEGVEAGQPLVEQATKKMGDRPATRALRALAWAIATERGTSSTVPFTALRSGDEAELPLPLRVVPHLVRAVQAIERDERSHAVEEIRAGLDDVTTPAVATELGVLAFRSGDELLARKAALLALRFSGLYPRARVLAARVALLGGRLDEALRAIEKVDAKSLDAARVRAAVAYERLDGLQLNAALQVLAADGGDRELAALRLAPSVLSGASAPDSDRVQDLALPAVLWGESVAFDVALDTGRIDLGRTLERVSRDRAGNHPSFALRAARLARYLGKLEEAQRLSEVALAGSPPAARAVVERFFVLAAAGQPDAARELAQKYSTIVEDAPGYFDVLISAMAGRKSEAVVKAAKLPLPPDDAPLLRKVIAARAFALTKDLRAAQYLSEQLRAHPDHPDLKLAAEEFKK